MRHLIIGSGKMGKKHGSILASLGEDVSYRDILSDSKRDIFSSIPQADSVYICTPPETHLEYIGACALFRRPVFVEKPILDFPLALVYSELSLVACNWMFCDHIRPWENIERINIYYAPRDKEPRLDYAHFMMFPDPHIFKLVYAKIPKTVIYYRDGYQQEIHITPCNMFHAQMQYWLDCLKTGRPSIYPIERASKDINKLCQLIRTTDQYSFGGLSDRTSTLNITA